MSKLEKRIAALETTSARFDDMTIIRRVINPGHLHTEIHRLRDDDGKEWTRQPGETEQQLIDRVSIEVKRNLWGVSCLTADAAEVPFAGY